MALQNNTEEPTVFGPDIETTGTSPQDSELVTIQYRQDGELYLYRRWEYESERDLLLDWLNDWKRIKRSRRRGGAQFIGFNVLKFDVPFLLWKAQQYDIASEPNWSEQLVWENIAHGPAYLDLAQLLGDDMLGFAEWRNLTVGTYGEYQSAQIPKFYERAEYDKIEMYIRDEMATFEQVFSEIQQEPFYQMLMELRDEARDKWKPPE